MEVVRSSVSKKKALKKQLTSYLQHDLMCIVEMILDIKFLNLTIIVGSLLLWQPYVELRWKCMKLAGVIASQ